MSAPIHCNCPTPDVPQRRDRDVWCARCKLMVDAGRKSDTITEADRKFAAWQIGMLQKGILQSERMIHELRQRYEIQE